jgi:hypothetical protein
MVQAACGLTVLARADHVVSAARCQPALTAIRFATLPQGMAAQDIDAGTGSDRSAATNC